MSDKQQASVWRDLFDPGWREREAERMRALLEKIPLRQPSGPVIRPPPPAPPKESA